MNNTSLITLKIRNYVDTICVYVNDAPVKEKHIISTATYQLEVPKGYNIVRVEKNTNIETKEFKKKAILSWLSTVSGIADFTLREVLLEAYTSSIECRILVEDNTKIMLTLGKDGFNVEECNSKFSVTCFQNTINQNDAKKLKTYYVIPMVFIATLIIATLFGVFMCLVFKNAYIEAFIVLILNLFLGILFVVSYKKSTK